MTSDSDTKHEYLESILARTAAAAVNGKLTSNDRNILYKLALTVAAEEFYRIESNSGHGLVSPEVLLLLQQIVLVCEDEVDQVKLLGGMGLTLEDVSDAAQAKDSGGSESDVIPIRDPEQGSPGDDSDVDGTVRAGPEGGDEDS